MIGTLRFRERFNRQGDRISDVCPAARDGFGVDLVESFQNGLVVDGQGRLDERPSRECNQPDPVVRQGEDQFLRGKPSSREPVRRKIVRQHASAGIDSEHDTAPPALDLLDFEPELRPGQSRNEKEDSHRLQSE